MSQGSLRINALSDTETLPCLLENDVIEIFSEIELLTIWNQQNDIYNPYKRFFNILFGLKFIVKKIK